MANKFSIRVTDHTGDVIRVVDSNIRMALSLMGDTVEGYAKEDCPVDTGLLHNSITHGQGGGKPKITSSLDSPMSLSSALAGLSPHNGDQIKGQDDFAYYRSSTHSWVGGLTTLIPGNGYMYNNNGSPTSFYYPSAKKGDVAAYKEPTYWSTDAHQHATNLTMMVTLDAEAFALKDGGYEIGAFVDGECRGAARLLYLDGDTYVAFLTVNGEEGETVEFALYDVYADRVQPGMADETIVYQPNAVYGSVEEPMTLHLQARRQEAGNTFS